MQYKTKISQRLKKIPLLAKLNAIVKPYLQEYWAANSLAWYRRRAAARCIIPLKGDDLQKALRKRLMTRALERFPKPMEKLHIFIAYCVNNWESVLPRSLYPFGKVTAFDWREHGFGDDTSPDWLEKRGKMNAAMLNAFYQANHKQPVDAVIGYLSGFTMAPQTLEKMTDAGAAIFNFCFDDKLNFPGKLIGGRYPTPAALASVVDLNLTNAPDSVVKYAVHGGLAMFWPEAAHPDIHKPYDVPFKYDVSFIGACYGWRPAFIDRLRKYGIRVECFGKGWSNGSLSDEEMVKLYSQSRINLGFAGVGYSRRLMCLKGRDFEVPMSGGLYLTQDNPELRLVFDLGREIVTYQDEADCAHIISELLRDHKRAEAIRNAGRARCLKDHTYKARWEQVFRLAGIIEN